VGISTNHLSSEYGVRGEYQYQYTLNKLKSAQNGFTQNKRTQSQSPNNSLCHKTKGLVASARSCCCQCGAAGNSHSADTQSHSQSLPFSVSSRSTRVELVRSPSVSQSVSISSLQSVPWCHFVIIQSSSRGEPRWLWRSATAQRVGSQSASIAVTAISTESVTASVHDIVHRLRLRLPSLIEGPKCADHRPQSLQSVPRRPSRGRQRRRSPRRHPVRSTPLSLKTRTECRRG